MFNQQHLNFGTIKPASVSALIKARFGHELNLLVVATAPSRLNLNFGLKYFEAEQIFFSVKTSEQGKPWRQICVKRTQLGWRLALILLYFHLFSSPKPKKPLKKLFLFCVCTSSIRIFWPSEVKCYKFGLQACSKYHFNFWFQPCPNYLSPLSGIRW